MNKVVLIGNLVNDPEVRVVPTGESVVSETIAVKREFKNPNGEYDTDFIDFVAWGNQAKFLGAYCSKGNKIAISGRWQKRSYQTKDGTTRWVNECWVDSVENLTPATQNQNKQNQEEDRTQVYDDDDLPF